MYSEHSNKKPLALNCIIRIFLSTLGPLFVQNTFSSEFLTDQQFGISSYVLLIGWLHVRSV